MFNSRWQISTLFTCASYALLICAAMAASILLYDLASFLSLSSKHLVVVLTLTTVGSIGCYLSSRFFKSQSNESLGGEIEPSDLKLRANKSRWVIAFQILATFLILSRTTWDVFHAPLDSDETYLSCYFSSDPWHVINPIGHHRNHGVSTAAAYVSRTLFGLDEISIRLPAIFFTAILLIGINILCAKFASSLTCILIFGNLLANQLVIWFLHSMRGYVSMMAICLLAMLVVLGSLYEPNKKRGFAAIALFALLMLMGMFTHTFGAIFLVMLLGTILLWFYFNPQRYNLNQKRFFHKLVLVSILVSPVFAILFFSILKDVSAFGFLYSTVRPDMSTELLRLVGIGQKDSLWFVVFFFGVLVFLSLRRFRKSKSDYVFLFLTASFTLVLGLMVVVQANIVEGRMFLAILVPLIFWVGESVNKIPHWFVRRALICGAILIFVILPLPNKPSLFNINPEIQSGIKDFSVKVRKEIEDGACVTVSGAEHQVYWAKNLYLYRPTSRRLCSVKYHVYFGHTRSDAILFSSSHLATHLPVFSDEAGRALYRVR